MKKKNKIILGSVIAICILGLVCSIFIDWPVDINDADGDIAKSSRFSRKEATEKLTNMEELLQNDPAFKDGIVAAQVVMQTRAAQFAALVDMSNEVAGGISEFGGLLKEMNASRVTVENVNNSLAEAGGELDAALGGEERPDLAQNTINAALAYTTLQKLNKLANQFIETTDKYLETAQGDDRLKLVRDQWLEYQQVTAALEGDKESADKLASKGNLLTGEKSLAALASFGLYNQMAIYNSCDMAQKMNVQIGLANQIPADVLGRISSIGRDAAGAMRNSSTGEAIQNSQTFLAGYTRIAEESMRRNTATDGVIKQVCTGLERAAKVELGQAQKNGLNQAQKSLGQAQKGLGQTQQGLANTNNAVFMSTVKMASAANVMSAYSQAISNAATALRQTQGSLSNTIGDVINQTAIGNRSTISLIPDL